MREVFSRNYTLLFIAFLTAASAFNFIFPVVPVFAVKELGMSEMKVGLIVGVFSLSALFSRPFTGFLADRFSRKLVLLFSLTLAIFAFFSYIFAFTVLMLLSIRVLHGAGWSGVYTSTYTLAADVLPENKRGEGIGYFSVLMPFAMVIFPALGLEFCAKSSNYYLVFLISAIVTIFALITVSFIKAPDMNTTKKTFSLKLGTFYDKRTFGIAVIQLFYSIMYSGLITFMPLFVLKYNVGRGSWFFIVYALSVILARFFIVRRTFDRRGPDILLLSGFLLFSSGAFSFSIATNDACFILSAALAGLGGGMISPTINAMAMAIVEPPSRGRANAGIFTANDIGMSIGSIILGVLVEYTSYRFAYRCASFILIIPLLWYFLFERRRYHGLVRQNRS